jgi:2-polyprenyl-3-methyl-5-hydroxy-6-metoxy-1,4-benzoquinol methylase
MTTVNQKPVWLPDKKYYEYSYHKFFNPEVEYDFWTPWDQWNYPTRDLLRFDHIIGQQLEHIQDKRVLDIACHLGYLSLFCLHNGASYVTGTNIRDRELSIAREVVGLAGYKNVEFKNSNIYNIEEFDKLCNSHDTVLLSGILYHINNHYQILKTIADSSAQTIIIESMLNDSINIGDNPIINWKFEDVAVSTLGFEDNQQKTFVGVPNHKWIEKALLQLGFNIIYNEIFEFTVANGTLSRRCVIVGQKS